MPAMSNPSGPVHVVGGGLAGSECAFQLAARGVPQVAFRPDWNRHKKAAPFKRNERLIDAMPAGLVVFSGTGIQDNLVDKARAFGIPVWDFRLKEA